MSQNVKIILLILVKLIFVIIILFMGVNVLLREDLLKSINLDYETNDFCQTIINSSDNNLKHYICDNKFKKDKVIILFIDSLPFDTLHDFHNLSENKLTNFFRSEGIEYKQSGALFETILTGKFSRNYLASNEMKMDNLQRQFHNSNMNISYRIRNFPLYGLFNKTIIDKNKLENYEDSESIPLSTVCNINTSLFSAFKEEISKNYIDKTGLYFKEGINKEYLYQKADEKLKKEFKIIRDSFNQCFFSKDFNSYIFYTDAMDHINHISHRNHPLSIFGNYFIEKYVKELINWINEEHDEFALALVSDHGGQIYFGEDTLCNHGCNSLGNEGVFFVYTKELGENFEKYKMPLEKGEIPIVSLNDFACTVTQALKNTNLPLESTCTPRLIGNDKLIFFSTVKSKEMQLKKYIEKLTKKYPELKNQYEGKYFQKLNNNKYNSYFKDLDSIYHAEEKFYNDYMNYLIDIQNELLNDVVKSGQNNTYYLIFYLVLISFIILFLYFIRKLIVLTREKVFTEMKKEGDNKNPFLPKIVTYTYIIVFILLIEPLMCLFYNNSTNISYYIRLSIFFKFFSLFFLVICVIYFKNIKNNNYKKLIFNIIFIILSNLISSQIELFTSLDKFVNTQKKINFFKIYLSYPLLIIYGFCELYSNRNYYFCLFKKYKIRYIYILIPYLIILSYYILLFDFDLKIMNQGHSPEVVSLLKRIYRMMFILLFLIKPFIINDKKNKSNNDIVISSDIINLKLFFFIVIIFICTELERVEIILLFNFVLFYLCLCFKKEQDIFIKMIYMILIICYPQIHFIANQGTYTMDTSIKVTNKCPSKWADDRPIVMGIIFVVHKFKFNIMDIGYILSLIKISNKKVNNYYTELIRLILNIQLFGILICFLYYIKKEREGSYIQILYLIATQVGPLIIFDITFLVNYMMYIIINSFIKKKDTDYEIIEKLDVNIEENKI